MLRLVVGKGCARKGAHAVLAVTLADHARAIGLQVRATKLSRNPASVSRYLHLGDAGGRLWIVRVSNHRRAGDNGHARPHLDLVSIDGIAGYQEGCRYLDTVAAGEAAWTDPGSEPVRKRRWL